MTKMADLLEISHGLMMDSAACIECDRPVRARQEGLQCDECDRWQHRTCKTGISRSVYRATVRGEPNGLQIWYCNYCIHTGMEPDTSKLTARPAHTMLTNKPAASILSVRPTTPMLTEKSATPVPTMKSTQPTLTETPVMSTPMEGPPMSRLMERSVSPILIEKPFMPTVTETTITPTPTERHATSTMTERAALPMLTGTPDTPTLKEKPDTPTLKVKPDTPTVTEGPSSPMLTERSVTPTLTDRQAPAMSRLIDVERSVIPKLTTTSILSYKRPAISMATEGPWPATPMLRPVTPKQMERPYLATPTVIGSPVTPQMEDLQQPFSYEHRRHLGSTVHRHHPYLPLQGQRQHSPLQRRPVMMETNSSSDESDDSDIQKRRRFDLLPCRFRQHSPTPASDATFIVEREYETDMYNERSLHPMYKAFLANDSEEDSDDDKFWFPGMRTNFFLDEEDETRYEILENSTTRGRKKLVSSDGYSYTVKESSARTTTWSCSIQNQKVQCPAYVIQRGQNFTRGLNDHVHIGKRFLTKRLKTTSKVKSQAMKDRHLAAQSLVKTVLQNEANTHALPQVDNLIRIINCQRSKLRHQQ